MSPSYRTAEQYQRWHIRDCARRGRRAAKAANWSDGPICRTCPDRALRDRGCCPGCGTERLLPGRDRHGAPICRDCAGITRSFFCDRCGFEGRLHTGRLCERCTFTDKVTAALDDGTGRTNPMLQPLADHLIAMPDPWIGWMWLRHPWNQALLADLATGRVPLTHEALHQLPNWRTVAYVRDLLMACGVLPATDKQLPHFETWLTHRLTELQEHPHQQTLRRFAIWELLPRLRARAETRPLTPNVRRFASERFGTARKFLTWLDSHDRTPATCTQADLDAWHATHHEHDRRALRAFLLWAMANHLMPRLALPAQQAAKGTRLSQHRRLELIRRAATDSRIPLPTRVAAFLTLLYAQPVSRLLRLTIDDVLHHNGEVLLRLGDPPTPVPEPFAALLADLIDHRQNMNTATNPDARWLFPGRRAGQPLNIDTMLRQLKDHGFPAQAARTTTLRRLVLQAPAPVIAQSLGFHHNTATRVATEAGQTWTRYAPGDHTQ
ncbi:hypothetical protein [Actinoallomurus sp. CA-150999]|uniref:hypothetical protein n=1 Tax=Actinoallomurus sp. CA-150999 TaxID=3239887 RepID=UPI003D94F905